MVDVRPKENRHGWLGKPVVHRIIFSQKWTEEKSVTALIGAPNLSQAMLRPKNRAQEMELEFAELKTSWWLANFPLRKKEKGKTTINKESINQK